MIPLLIVHSLVVAVESGSAPVVRASGAQVSSSAAIATPGSVPPNYLTPITQRPFGARAGYFHVSPGLFGLLDLSPAFPWGAAVGALLPTARGALVSVGGFAEHMIQFRRDPDPVLGGRMQAVRAGAEVRFGRARRRVFGYALLRAGLDVLLSSRARDLGLLMSLGGGAQRLVGRRMLLGGEAAGDVGLFPHGGPVVLPSFRLRFFLGLKF